MAPRPSAGSLNATLRSVGKGFAAPSLNQGAEGSAIGRFMLPGTMVPPPVLRSIKSNPAEGVKLQWARAKLRVMDAVRVALAWYNSKPGMLKPARLRVKRASLIPTAKALHRTMSEALAAGDRTTLRRVCVPTLYEDLSARLARRPKGHRYEWSLDCYTNTLQFPRIVDHKVAALPTGNGQLTLVHQAVVAISSRQRLVQHQDLKRGESVPGSSKTVDLVENIIMIRPIDFKTYRAGEWAIFGHAEETTWEGFAAEERALQGLAKQ